MGASMPRYSRENLHHDQPLDFLGRIEVTCPSFLTIFLKQSTMPEYAFSPVAVPDCSCLQAGQLPLPTKIRRRGSHSGLDDI